MKRKLAALFLIVLMLASIIPVKAVADQKQFSDVPDSAWYLSDLNYITEDSRQILSGFPDGTYKPDAYITVGQFIKCTISAKNITLQPSTDGSYWAKPFIDKAIQLGYIKNGEFASYGSEDSYAGYEHPITRGEMARIIGRSVQDITETYNYRDPKLINNLMKDYSDIPSSLQSWVTKCYDLGILCGYPDGTYRQGNLLTRKEAVSVLRRMIDENARKKVQADIDKQLQRAESSTDIWNLVWSDEFSGNSVDQKKWTYEVGGEGWGNNELEYYTDGENASVVDGCLVIEARKQSYDGSKYTSARMITKDKAFWTYGKVEARIKLPYGKGIWPAFWMMGQNYDSVSWPQCGEIDIMEMVGGTPQPDWDDNNAVIWGSLHRPDGDLPEPKSHTGSYTNPDNEWFSDDFHVFGVVWDKNSIQYYVDGNKYSEVDISSGKDGYDAFRKPFFILLNLAVGGDWPGSPDSTTVWPQKMLVDWVRVYQKY